MEKNFNLGVKNWSLPLFNVILISFIIVLFKKNVLKTLQNYKYKENKTIN